MDNKNQNYFLKLFFKYFNSLSLVFFVLLLALTWFLFLESKYETAVKQTRDDNSKAEYYYNKKKNYLNSLEALAAAYNEIKEEDREKINLTLPDNFIQEELFSEVQNIVSNNGLLLQEISIKPTVVKDDSKKTKNISGDQEASSVEIKNISSLDVSISVMGANYKSLKNLLSSFENNLPLVDVKNIEFNPDGGLNLKLTTYFFKK